MFILEKIRNYNNRVGALRRHQNIFFRGGNVAVFGTTPPTCPFWNASNHQVKEGKTKLFNLFLHRSLACHKQVMSNFYLNHVPFIPKRLPLRWPVVFIIHPHRRVPKCLKSAAGKKNLRITQLKNWQFHGKRHAPESKKPTLGAPVGPQFDTWSEY